MFFLAGQAASSALDLISALQQTLAGKNSPTPSTPSTTAQTFDPNAGSAGDATASTATSAPATPLAPTTMGAMLTVQGSNGQTLVNGDAFSSQLFGLLDGNIDGSISQSEFEAAFNKNGDTTKADAIFAQLDANHDGTVSPDELTNALSGQGQADGGQQVGHHHHHHHGMSGAGGASPSTGSGDPNDPFSTSASNGSNGSNDPFAGDQSQTVTNADGSSTTTITYADGSQVAMTTPATNGTGTSPAAWEHNVIERMIQRQAQMMAASPTGQGFAISA
jgi:hypothetical protein